MAPRLMREIENGGTVRGGRFRTARAVHLVFSLVAVLVVLVFVPLGVGMKVAVSVIGAVLGFLSGQLEWKRTAARVDRRNVVILYVTDGFFFSLTFVLFMIQMAPRLAVELIWVARTFPVVLPLLTCIVSASWAGYSFAIWRGVRRFEAAHGMLRTKEFWSQSPLGQEGMISREGVVIERCDPFGRVRIGPEIWTAESLDGTEIDVADRVIVRDIEGLRVIVERPGDGRSKDRP